jgi:hypothetical protein
VQSLCKTICIACVGGALLASAPSAPAAGAREGRLASASAFAKGIVRLIGENRYADAWTRLHPLHQKAAPLDRYVACEDLTPIPGQITSLRTIRVWRAPVVWQEFALRFPGRGRASHVIADASIPASSIIVKTVSVVRVARRLVWILPPDRYAAYLAGACP